MPEFNDVNCIVTLGNTGLSNCKDNLGADAKILWTKAGFSFASLADAQDESKYTDAINAKNMYPFPLFVEVEPALEDDVVEDTGLGFKLFVREGKYGGKGRYELAACNMASLRTFNILTSGRAFIVTTGGKVYGTSPDGIEFKGFDLSYFRQSGFKGSDGATKRKSELEYQFKSPSEMFDYPAIPAITWDPLQLSGLINVVMSVPAGFTSSSVIVSVTRTCDNEAVVGLVEADFIFLDASGTTVLPANSFLDNEDGTYTFGFAPVLATEAHTVTLKTAANQTTGGYESTGAASFTIT